ncbi:MAG: AAA family ATPase [Termitinemataceae bacterium]|nr:MAG: AAA family ATPase [Termitinemataceae bacterium]
MNKKNPCETPLPIGISFFDDMIEKGYYYVDKTLLIKEILDKAASVNLFTRPRRFGKTLNMRMLQCFFEDTREVTGKDRSPLFSGLKIMQAGEKYLSKMAQYPLVFLTFKDARQIDFDRSFSSLKDIIRDEYRRHSYLLEDPRLQQQKEQYERIVKDTGEFKDYSAALKFLTECLSIHHEKKVIVLLDEYDVPLEASWSNNYYNDMIAFIRTFLGTALKDNEFLEFAVITGCLRISKESIFTGLNNLAVNSILSDKYSEFFGFTQDEIDELLKFYSVEEKAKLVKDWYDGYLFGKTEVYNPWSSLKITEDLISDINANPLPYWVNTSSNSIVRTIIDKADETARTDLSTLVAGGTIKKQIHEDVTYDEVDKNIDNVWNFLFFTGYLKKVGEETDVENNIIAELKIPNIELAYIFKNKIHEWFKESIEQKDLSVLYTAVLDGDVSTFEDELSELLLDSISFYDSAENFYHGFLTGVLYHAKGYLVKSNRESGNGRGDIFMRYRSAKGKAIIFELKVSPSMQELEKKCEEALQQIEEKHYAKELEDEGYKTILKYGIAFYKKDCMVRKK